MDEESFTPLTYSLSAPGEALHRASEFGCGVLSVGRAWVRYEGWLMKEAGLAGGWHMRYFFVNGSRLEYFKEETAKVNLGSADALGCTVDHSNVVTAFDKGGGSSNQKDKVERALQEGDVVIGLNGEAVVHDKLHDAVSRARAAAGASSTLTLTFLRPKGKIALAGASVSIGGGRKQGGYTLHVSNQDAGSRRSRHTLVCVDERSCFGWVAAIREAIAAAAMENIKTTISQALQLQALQSNAMEA